MRMMRKKKSHKMLALIEPKVALDELVFRRLLGFQNILSNVTNNIWLCWQDEVSVDVIVSHEQFLHVRVNSNQFWQPFYCKILH